jgi:hypothetical protein
MPIPTNPPLGFIPAHERTPEQAAAHAQAVASFPSFGIGPAAQTELKPGEACRLFDFWKSDKVVADVGFVFPRFHQLTGSCVGAGGGQALFTLIAVQRNIAANPTKAFIPFWPFDYGRSRHNDWGSGEWWSRGDGSLGSTFAAALVKDGVIDAATPGLPAFKQDDGLVLTSTLEMDWSVGNQAPVINFLDAAKVHPLGTAALVKTTADIEAGVINGYPCAFCSSYYVGNGSWQGTGEGRRYISSFNTSGGHQQSILAVENHSTLGKIFWAQNNWPRSSYPDGIAGEPPCGAWIKEDSLQRTLDHDGTEAYQFSHLPWFPAQPDVMDWYQ